MTKPTLITAALVVATTAQTSTAEAQNIKTKNGKPLNIIHILVDDVGWDDISCFGSKDIKTPRVDQLASQGMSFTNFMAPHPTSTPSRAAILTGRYAPRMNGATGLEVLFPKDTIGIDPKQEITMATLLQKKGYSTGLIGKWHLGCVAPFLPTYNGFDRYFGLAYPNDHGPERLAGTGSGHRPMIALFDQDSIVKRLNNVDLSELPHQFLREACDFMATNVASDKPFYLHWANIETHTPWFIPRGFEGRSTAGAFGDAVEYMDLTVGIFLDYLKKLGIEDNTLIIFSSDNGPLVGYDPELYNCYGRFGYVDPDRTHALREGKYQARYDGGFRTTCIMRLPGIIPEGTKSEELITGADFFTTFLEMAGGQIPQDRPIDGRNILPLMTAQPGAQSPHAAFIGSRGRHVYESIRQGDWKYVVKNGGELYNIRQDIGETQDLSAKYPEKVNQLKDLLNQGVEAIKAEKPLPKSFYK